MPTMLASHQPCPDCGSSDALAVYEWGTKCYSCGKVTRDNQPQQSAKVYKLETLTKPDLVFQSVADRQISKDTAEKYGVGVYNNNYYFPYFSKEDSHNPIAYKKRGVQEKRFSTEGKWSSAGLFGEHLFSKGGRYVTIVEGEFDALAAYQMLGSKYPVVSIRNGASSALQDCKASFEWLDSFNNIVICFDADQPGVVAASQVAELFGTKARVFKHDGSLKDACDYLKEGESKKFMEHWWASEQYVPDGIVCGSQLWDLVNQPIEKAEVLYPYDGLNKLTYGIRQGELVTVTAGSGLGKSQFLREIVFHILKNSTENIGLMFLEESVKKTARSMMSLAANKPLHVPDVEATEQEIKQAFDETLGTDRLYFFDHFGSTAVDNIVNRVRFMAKALNCRYIFLDHISIVVSAQENGDERKALDEIMTKLRMLVQETGICLFAVSHLKRPESKGHEEGAATSLAQLRGSGSIGQLSDMVIGLERNGQSDDLIERHTTRVRVLKNRAFGLTGPACSLYYDKNTGRMTERNEEL